MESPAQTGCTQVIPAICKHNYGVIWFNKCETTALTNDNVYYWTTPAGLTATRDVEAFIECIGRL